LLEEPEAGEANLFLDPGRVKGTLGAVAKLSVAGIDKARATAYKMEQLSVGKAFTEGVQSFRMWALNQAGGSLSGLHRWVKGEDRTRWDCATVDGVPTSDPLVALEEARFTWACLWQEQGEVSLDVDVRLDEELEDLAYLIRMARREQGNSLAPRSGHDLEVAARRHKRGAGKRS
jgi:hypothetical protein